MWMYCESVCVCVCVCVCVYAVSLYRRLVYGHGNLQPFAEPPV